MNSYYFLILLGNVLGNNEYKILPTLTVNNSLIITFDEHEICILEFFHHQINIYTVNRSHKTKICDFFLSNQYEKDVNLVFNCINNINQKLKAHAISN